jgi:hypothetical protein
MTIYERKNIRRNIFFIYDYEEDILIESSDFSASITNICLTIIREYYEIFPWIFSDKKGKRRTPDLLLVQFSSIETYITFPTLALSKSGYGLKRYSLLSACLHKHPLS